MSKTAYMIMRIQPGNEELPGVERAVGEGGIGQTKSAPALLFRDIDDVWDHVHLHGYYARTYGIFEVQVKTARQIK